MLSVAFRAMRVGIWEYAYDEEQNGTLGKEYTCSAWG